jgi:hypothetical protein
MEVDIEPEHLFSLEGCSNLSELTLDMEHSESCSVRDSIYILSTLNPGQLSGLGKIVLETSYVGRWFIEDSQANDEEDDQADSEEDDHAGGKVDWEGLDTVLSKLAKASISKGERLTFTLVVMRWGDNYKLMPTVRNWLPKQLAHFYELGLLHVHYGRGGYCRAVDGGCLHDKPVERF